MMIFVLLAQIGANPGGAAVIVAVLFLLILLLGALLLAVTLIRLMRLTQRPGDLVPAPKRWGRVGLPEIKPYNLLTSPERKAIFKVRALVFQVEQGIVAVPDQDEHDEQCEHVLVRVRRRVVGTARL